MRRLFVNARVYSTVLPAPDSVLVIDGIIEWVGKDGALQDFTVDEVIDCHNNWLAPSFVDAHVHLTSTGISANSQAVVLARNTAEVAQWLIANRLPNEITIGHGWDDAHWQQPMQPQQLPQDFAWYVSRIDVHSAVISSALVAMYPEIQELDGFEPQGIVKRAAHGWIREKVFSGLSADTISSYQQTALNLASSHGITLVEEMGGPQISSVVDASISVSHGGSFPAVNLWWGQLNGHEVVSELGAFGCGGDLFVDGSIGSCTAAMTSAYSNGAHGHLYLELEEVSAHIVAASLRKQPVSFHAIGDEAVERVLGGYLHAARQLGIKNFAGFGHRIEHCEFLTRDNLSLLVELNIAASMQPNFDALWGGDNGMYFDRMGERARALNPFGTILSSGGVVVASSDSPVTSMNKWESVRAMTEHHVTAERISSRAAFAAHNRSWWRHNGNSESGTISVGSKSHLALWEVPEFEQPTTDPAIKRWSTDPRSATPPLPDLSAGIPRCMLTIREDDVIYVAS